MKNDALLLARGQAQDKLVSKETLNHGGLINLVTGLDVYQAMPEVFRRACAALGIDIINRVSLDNAPAPTPPGQARRHPTLPYRYGNLGVYDTAQREALSSDMDLPVTVVTDPRRSLKTKQRMRREGPANRQLDR